MQSSSGQQQQQHAPFKDHDGDDNTNNYHYPSLGGGGGRSDPFSTLSYPPASPVHDGGGGYHDNDDDDDNNIDIVGRRSYPPSQQQQQQQQHQQAMEDLMMVVDETSDHGEQEQQKDGLFDMNYTVTRTSGGGIGKKRRMMLMMMNPRRKLCLIGGICVLFIFIMGIILGVVLSGKNDDGTSSAQQEQQGGGSGSSSDGGDHGFIPSPGSPYHPKPAPSDPSPSSGDSSSTYGSGISTPAPSSELEYILRDWSMYGGNEFDDPDSYQSRALLWIQNNPPPTNTNDLQRQYQRFALVCIYYATNSVINFYTNDKFGINVMPEQMSWARADGWLTSNSDECTTWDNIICNENGHVTELHLEENKLTGTFPSEIQLLKHSLTYLDLSVNYFENSGEINNIFLGELTNLQYLYTADTYFDYNGIPTQIGKLTKLIEYDCAYSSYYGPLHNEIFTNMLSLEYLYISGNSYNSSIPTSLALLPNLTYVYISNTNLTGTLEDIINIPNGMPSIIEFWIDQNPQLTGSIPSTIGNWKTMQSLSLTENSITGSIPSEMGKLIDMKQMWFYSNLLTGSIPTEIGLLQDMERFEIEHNNIVDEMPVEICNLRNPITSDKGVLSELEADCSNTDGDVEKVICSSSCCTCCGLTCLGEYKNEQAINDEVSIPSDEDDNGGLRRHHRRRRLH